MIDIGIENGNWTFLVKPFTEVIAGDIMSRHNPFVLRGLGTYEVGAW